MKRPLVLIVDDEVDIAEMIGALLEAEDYDVEYAGNGREALEVIARLRPDVILTDVMMPVMSGPEMLTELRTQGAQGDIPVILMSAADPHRLARAFGVPHLQKPFRIEALLDGIRAQLGR